MNLEERHALAGDVVGALDEELRRLRRDLDLDAAAMGLFDRLEQLALAELRVREDHLVDALSRQHARQRLQVAEQRQIETVRLRREDADERVVDAPPPLAEHLVQVREVLAGADEQRASAHADSPEQPPGGRVVRAPKQRDQERRQDEGSRREPVGGEPVTGAEAERERDQDDEEERRGDPTESRPPLSLGVEIALREDEYRDQDQEGQP